MADASQQEKIDQFTNLTGTDADRAKFYLGASGWQLEVALASFYDDDDDDGDEGASHPTPQAGSGRFGRLTTGNDSDSDEEGQTYFAGGSERSGELIVGPPKKKDSNDLVQDLFKAAKEHGAEEVGADDDQAAGKLKKKAKIFKGAGYRLGETEDDSEQIHAGPIDDGTKQVDVTLTFWKNGFSVDDGPLRDFMDPKNKPFLDSIQRGEIPMELIRLARGGEVQVNMVDKKSEDYIAPKKKLKAFSGTGNMLGSPAPTVTSTPQPNPVQNAAAQPAISVDETQPTTQLQIRLSDGSRLQAKFNHAHTVNDIRRYICSSRPEFAQANFVLQTTFPNKELTDESQTLADGKLINAVVVQRMK